jgi:hypothetical protein
MKGRLQAEKNLVRLGIIAGAVTALTYFVSTFVPLPAAVERVIFIYSGPLLVVAIVGAYQFLRRPHASASAMLGAVFGIVAGVTRMLFSVVQEANVERFSRITVMTDPAAQQMWRDIRGSIFSVQNGMNYRFDCLGEVTGYLFAIAMWRHPKFGKPFSIAAVLLVSPHFVMKLITFPKPPASAGLFDAGPLSMLVLAAVIVQMAWHLSWMDTWRKSDDIQRRLLASKEISSGERYCWPRLWREDPVCLRCPNPEAKTGPKAQWQRSRSQLC